MSDTASVIHEAAEVRPDLYWKNLCATKAVLPATLEAQLHDLVSAAIKNGYGWVTLSGSAATCAAVSKWAKAQGFYSFISKEGPADAALEKDVPTHHVRFVRIEWATMFK